MKKNPLKSRMVWVGIVLKVLGVLQLFAQDFPIKPLYQGIFLIIVGALIVMLRFDTNAPIIDN